MPLVIAAKVDPFDREYYEREIAPRIDGDRIRFVGEVSGARKVEVLQGAIALLHLVQWPEPFGLVMAEAMACGTPVIAMAHGSIPEVVSHGRTGFVVHALDQAVEALSWLGRTEPRECRREAVARFDAARMGREYLALYEAIALAPADGGVHGRC
ncbi:Spore coat protein SA [compost metagenome]